MTENFKITAWDSSGPRWGSSGHSDYSGNFSWTLSPSPSAITERFSRLRHLDKLRDRVHRPDADLDLVDEWEFLEAVKQALLDGERQRDADEQMVVALTQRLERMELHLRNKNKMFLKMFDVLGEMIVDPQAKQFLALLRETMIMDFEGESDEDPFDRMLRS